MIKLSTRMGGKRRGGFERRGGWRLGIQSEDRGSRKCRANCRALNGKEGILCQRRLCSRGSTQRVKRGAEHAHHTTPEFALSRFLTMAAISSSSSSSSASSSPNRDAEAGAGAASEVTMAERGGQCSARAASLYWGTALEGFWK